MSDKQSHSDPAACQRVIAESFADVDDDVDDRRQERPVATNPVTRTVSDSAAYATRSIQKETRTRSVTFYDANCDRQKRRLQRTPTPYWPRKGVDLADDDDDPGSSFDDDAPSAESSPFSPDVSLDGGGQPSARCGLSRISGWRARRLLYSMSSSSTIGLGIDEETDNDGDTCRPEATDDGDTCRPEATDDGDTCRPEATDASAATSDSDPKDAIPPGAAVSPLSELYNNPLFRKAVSSLADSDTD